MRTTPTILPPGVQRRFPWSDQARGLRVPLIPPKRGEDHTGFIKVTKAMADAPLGTDLYQQKLNLLGRQISRWLEWKAKQGWKPLARPHVSGPWDPPVGRTGEEAEDCQWYWVRVPMTRETPLYVLLDDYLEIDSRARRYRVDLNDPASWALPKPKDEIITAEQPHDPVADAALRRAAQDMPPEDLRFPEPDWDALAGA